MDREAGFKDVIQKQFPRIKIVAEQFSMSDRAKGLAATENILTIPTWWVFLPPQNQPP